MFLSPQALVSCASFVENSTLYPSDAGCNGGNSLEALRFMHLVGAPSMNADQATGCLPYTSSTCVTGVDIHGDPNNDGCHRCEGLLDQCSDTGLPPEMHRVSSFGTINAPPLPERDDPAVNRPVTADVRQRELNIMREIYTNGPVLACIFDYDNWNSFFNNYPLGIYNNTEGSPSTGGHCINLMGWGADRATGMKYWIVRNSWGPAWGSSGVVRILKGVDYLGIENDVWAACPEGAAHCALTAAVDTSVMDVSLSVADRAAAGLGVGRGGYWQEAAPDSAPVQRALAAYLADCGADGADASAAGVVVTAAFTQVANGLQVRQRRGNAKGGEPRAAPPSPPQGPALRTGAEPRAATRGRNPTLCRCACTWRSLPQP